MSGKKGIRVKFVDCDFFQKCCMPILEKRYDVIITEDNPDYAFFDCFSMKRAVDYQCVRILYIGENIRPDFNLFDYAIGFDELFFADRYLKMPLFAMPINVDTLLIPAIKKNELIANRKIEDKQFCCFMVSNGSNAEMIRETVFRRISEYKKVDSAGAYLNNMPNGYQPSLDDTLSFIGGYKFYICFENSTFPGYVTEKIVSAWASGTVPIYWGDPTIEELFNPDAFLHLKDASEEAIYELVQKIKELDEDEEAYNKMLTAPIFRNDVETPEYLKPETFEKFMFRIFDQEPKVALRRTNSHIGWGKFYEDDMRRYQEMDSSKLINLIWRIKRKLKGRNS